MLSEGSGRLSPDSLTLISAQAARASRESIKNRFIYTKIIKKADVNHIGLLHIKNFYRLSEITTLPGNHLTSIIVALSGGDRYGLDFNSLGLALKLGHPR